MRKILIIVFMIILLKRLTKEEEIDCKFFPKKCRGYIAREKVENDRQRDSDENSNDVLVRYQPEF